MPKEESYYLTDNEILRVQENLDLFRQCQKFGAPQTAENHLREIASIVNKAVTRGGQ